MLLPGPVGAAERKQFAEHDSLDDERRHPQHGEEGGEEWGDGGDQEAPPPEAPVIMPLIASPIPPRFRVAIWKQSGGRKWERNKGRRESCECQSRPDSKS